MGLFDRDNNVRGGSGTARAAAAELAIQAQADQAQNDQAQAEQEPTAQQPTGTGDPDGSPATIANTDQVSEQTHADRELLAAYAQELHRIIAVGRPGTSVVLAAVDTGEQISGNPWFQLDVEVTLPGQTPYLVSRREMVAAQFLARYATGTTHGVAVDPADPQNIAFTS
ncbi:hypothetical protein EDF60_0904 [Leucobacter luti]|uniref:hypothetical protein n=1 Tax=Leucobacter luti TaxID=340320 RepID=UPI0010433921|nr:hypothetical protein [Leucobacter luti]MCW2288167.1 hypothetical protein [Leucobacter luti]TCK45672.1 hypothetical protein EDF60_0904 [Leucobacter luti]